MPKFNWCKFAEDKFGTRTRYHNAKFRMAGTVPLGLGIRRTIGKGPECTAGAVTYRLRRGNGSAGSVAGKRYQDKYNYSAAMKAVNTGTPANKTRFTNGAAAWQALSDPEKAIWNRKATHGYKMSGYNLFLRDYILSN